MNYIQTISKVREQFMVKIVTIADGFRVEKLPVSHPQHPKKKLTKKEWDEIWQDFENFSKSGRQDVKLTDFLRKDRDTHF